MLLPMWNRWGNLESFTRNAFTLIDKKWHRFSGWPKASCYSRKHGSITQTFSMKDYTELDRITMARHSKSNSGMSTTLSYAHLPVYRKCENTVRLARHAQQLLMLRIRCVLFCNFVSFPDRKSIQDARQKAPAVLNHKLLESQR